MANAVATAAPAVRKSEQLRMLSHDHHPHPGGDGSTLTLHANSPVKARTRLTMNAPVVSLALGRADREFRLARTDAAACKAMDSVLKGP